MSSRRRSSGSRRRRVVGALAGVALLVVLLGVLAIPLLGVPGDAQAARSDLTRAMSALRSGDQAVAEESVASAREHVDEALDGAQGLGGDVWSWIPLLGTPVDDARHLVAALDEATSVAEIGVELYPSVAGKQATLFRDQQVDRDTLDEVIAGARESAEHLATADSELAEVEGSTPFVGDTITSNRDAAAEQVTPMAETLADLDPMWDQLPAALGFEGERSYLIAMLNPAELRYSGGATLSFAPMTWDQGALELGQSLSQADDPRLRTPLTWRKVQSNPFHRGDTLLANSTFAPSWSVSGEELLRAWQTARGTRHNGVLAVDVVALSRLLGVAGSITVPGYGELTEDNLVETLVGSYDDFYPDPTAQDPFNEAIIPAFQTRLFEGGNYVAKARALGEAAGGRHFAAYFRDDEVREGFAALGIEGDLAPPEGDYLAVATQNTNGSKADYYQRRHLALDVFLDEDGSATNRLDALVQNDTPPYVPPGTDPQTGYFTRWAGMALGIFLPGGVTVEEGNLRGEAWDPKVREFYEHSYVTRSMLLEPGSDGRAQLRYQVPAAATVEDSGDLTYRLALDPQGLVRPESAQVTVHLPDGYAATDLPEGWSARGGTLRFRTDALESQEWEIPLEARN